MTYRTGFRSRMLKAEIFYCFQQVVRQFSAIFAQLINIVEISVVKSQISLKLFFSRKFCQITIYGLVKAQDPMLFVQEGASQSVQRM